MPEVVSALSSFININEDQKRIPHFPGKKSREADETFLSHSQLVLRGEVCLKSVTKNLTSVFFLVQYTWEECFIKHYRCF